MGSLELLELIDGCFHLNFPRRLGIAALALACFAQISQGQTKKHVLMITEFGQSHPGVSIVTEQIYSQLREDQRFHSELYWENLDAGDASDEVLASKRESLIQEYGNRSLDLIVLLGPDPLRLATGPLPFFPNVPVVFCCTDQNQSGQLNPDSRSTGAWFFFDPAKTLDAALRLVPKTQNVFVVAGQSRYDRGLTAFVNSRLTSYQTRLSITYLTDLPMDRLQDRLRQLPDHSIVFYIAFFKDAQGRDFLNVTEALPMVTSASNSPVFGMASTYLGRGIVGGFVVNVEDQGEIAARDSLEILEGKSPQQIPIMRVPSHYVFDWRQLKRWKLNEKDVPAGSTLLFRQPTFLEEHWWTVITGLLIIAGLTLLAIYHDFKQKQLRKLQNSQKQLSGMLISAQEYERSRLASELHDDFSQRLALLALELENAEEAIKTSPDDAAKQIHALVDSTSEIGADLHTLSHRLHSSTLEKLGVVPGINSLCREFSAQQGIQVDFEHEDVPRTVHPEVALCLFRIVQEGLRNSKKHGGVRKAQVLLLRSGGGLQVSIRDEGIGFDMRDLERGSGLGVRSMEERVNLLGGRFEIHSQPGKGTRIIVSVPLQPAAERISR